MQNSDINDMKLYHFTSFNTFVKIWHSKSLLFQPYNNVNDCLERSKFVRVPDFSDESMNKLNELDNQLATYKQISLMLDYSEKVKGFMSTMMWGHYGDKGYGVCIELDSDKLDLSDNIIKRGVIHYSLDIKPPTLKKEDNILTFIDTYSDYFFFQKTKEWEGENEYRLISCTQAKIDINDAISAVYMFGYYRPETQTVLQLVGENILHIVMTDRMANELSYPIIAFKWKDIRK